MARTLQLLVCISAAMTASGGYKYPYSYNTWHAPHDFEDPETMGYPTHDRLNSRSSDRSFEAMVAVNDRSGAADSGDQVRRSFEGTYKIMNHGPKPAAVSRRRTGSADDKVLFPGPTSRNDEGPQGIPEDCRKHKLCDNVPDYPVDIANKIIAKLGDKIKYLSMDVLDETPEITQRVGVSDDHLELCDSHTTISYPEGGYDKNNKFHTVLNSKANPIQGVRVEICNSTLSSCKQYICNEHNYKTFCVQKYIYRPMLTIDNATNTEVEVQIAVPSCCACVAQTTYA